MNWNKQFFRKWILKDFHIFWMNVEQPSTNRIYQNVDFEEILLDIIILV